MAKVVITDRIKTPDIEAEILGSEVTIEPDPDAEVLLVWRERIDAKYLSRFPNLKAAIRYGIGYERMDLRAAENRNIWMCNNPEYCTEEVADTSLAMILSIQRNVMRLNQEARSYGTGWQENPAPRTQRTTDTVLGLVGVGRIGFSVARKARAIGFKVTFFDPYITDSNLSQLQELGAVRIGSLSGLTENCDILSLHAPLNLETQGLIDRKVISKMKPGAAIVNTARGAIISSLDDLYDALRSEHLSQVALDVLPEEPPMNCRLMDAWKGREPWIEGRLTLNPHKAYYSERSAREMRIDAAKNALRVIQGSSPKHIVNSVTRAGANYV
jgi:D-3-phosphoglycerate dehydrogenase